MKYWENYFDLSQPVWCEPQSGKINTEPITMYHNHPTSIQTSIFWCKTYLRIVTEMQFYDGTQ